MGILRHLTGLFNSGKYEITCKDVKGQPERLQLAGDWVGYIKMVGKVIRNAVQRMHVSVHGLLQYIAER